MELELLKAEAGMCDGRVLYHRHFSKTPEEAAALEEKQSGKVALKAERRSQQVGGTRLTALRGVCCY